MHVPVTLLVDLLEVDTIFENSPTPGEEEHAAEGEPWLVNETSEDWEQEEVKAPSIIGAMAANISIIGSWIHNFGYKRPIEQILQKLKEMSE